MDSQADKYPSNPYWHYMIKAVKVLPNSLRYLGNLFLKRKLPGDTIPTTEQKQIMIDDNDI